jgi:hypothetical protein
LKRRDVPRTLPMSAAGLVDAGHSPGMHGVPAREQSRPAGDIWHDVVGS